MEDAVMPLAHREVEAERVYEATMRTPATGCRDNDGTLTPMEIRQPVSVHGCAVMAAARIAVDEQVSAAVTAYVAHGHRLERLGFAADPHSSSASRFTAGASGFLLLIQSGERPERRDTLSLGCPVLSRCPVARRHLQVEPDI